MIKSRIRVIAVPYGIANLLRRSYLRIIFQASSPAGPKVRAKCTADVSEMGRGKTTSNVAYTPKVGDRYFIQVRAGCQAKESDRARVRCLKRRSTFGGYCHSECPRNRTRVISLQIDLALRVFKIQISRPSVIDPRNQTFMN